MEAAKPPMEQVSARAIEANDRAFVTAMRPGAERGVREYLAAVAQDIAAPVGRRSTSQDATAEEALRFLQTSAGRTGEWLRMTRTERDESGQFVQVLEHRTGVRIACLEEIALRMGFIDADECYALGEKLAKSGYGDYVKAVAVAAGASA